MEIEDFKKAMMEIEDFKKAMMDIEDFKEQFVEFRKKFFLSPSRVSLWCIHLWFWCFWSMGS